MVTGYILFVIALIFIIYSVVWRGECRFACRPEMFEDGGLGGRSGISGLVRRQSHPHADCVCGHCPCKVVAEVVKSCRPIIQMCNNSMDAVSQYCNNFADVLQNTGYHFATMLDCTPDRGRQAQLVTTGTIFNSTEDFTLSAKPEDVKPELVRPEPESTVEIPLMSKVSDISRYGAELVATLSEIALKLSTSLDPDNVRVPISHTELKAAASSSSGRPPFSADKNKPSTSPKTFLASINELPKKDHKHERERNIKEQKKERKDETKHKSVGTETTQPEPTPLSTPLSDSMNSLMNCSKCVIEGKTCVRECPSSKSKRENSNRK
ncbi:uncharacterized protein LOC111356187 [Spodoptera litura]|uniref:Uncharacterized protein LOC111356187 n=1 Tax=Spodoptera litura TaxID=69820 RepID=A0A9J7ISD6_SPOLT|nr:uncharacterized protein LOC111356187 [Spodoptera litura]